MPHLSSDPRPRQPVHWFVLAAIWALSGALTNRPPALRAGETPEELPAEVINQIKPRLAVVTFTENGTRSFTTAVCVDSTGWYLAPQTTGTVLPAQTPATITLDPFDPTRLDLPAVIVLTDETSHLVALRINPKKDLPAAVIDTTPPKRNQKVFGFQFIGPMGRIQVAETPDLLSTFVMTHAGSSFSPKDGQSCANLLFTPNDLWTVGPIFSASGQLLGLSSPRRTSTYSEAPALKKILLKAQAQTDIRLPAPLVDTPTPPPLPSQPITTPPNANPVNAASATTLHLPPGVGTPYRMIELPSPATRGLPENTRYVVLYMKALNKVAFFDPATEKIEQYLTLQIAGDVLAANDRWLLAVDNTTHQIQRADLNTWQTAPAVNLPSTNPVANLAIFNGQPAGTVLVAEKTTRFLDIETLQERDLGPSREQIEFQAFVKTATVNRRNEFNRQLPISRYSVNPNLGAFLDRQPMLRIPSTAYSNQGFNALYERTLFRDDPRLMITFLGSAPGILAISRTGQESSLVNLDTGLYSVFPSQFQMGLSPQWVTNFFRRSKKCVFVTDEGRQLAVIDFDLNQTIEFLRTRKMEIQADIATVVTTSGEHSFPFKVISPVQPAVRVDDFQPDYHLKTRYDDATGKISMNIPLQDKNPHHPPWDEIKHFQITFGDNAGQRVILFASILAHPPAAKRIVGWEKPQAPLHLLRLGPLVTENPKLP